jgi:hypothetical protein
VSKVATSIFSYIVPARGSYPYPGPKKGYYILSLSHQKKGYGYNHIHISYILCQTIGSIVTVSEQQKARPGSTAAHKSSTFYRIELKP